MYFDYIFYVTISKQLCFWLFVYRTDTEHCFQMACEYLSMEVVERWILSEYLLCTRIHAILVQSSIIC